MGTVVRREESQGVVQFHGAILEAGSDGLPFEPGEEDGTCPNVRVLDLGSF